MFNKKLRITIFVLLFALVIFLSYFLYDVWLESRNCWYDDGGFITVEHGESFLAKNGTTMHCKNGKLIFDEQVDVQELTSKKTSFSPYTARFEIITNGTTRIFTNKMYHRQSPDVYIESPDPNTIQINAEDITWADFFETLPFTLDEDCLITGTNQTFCSNATNKLYFYINNQENPHVLREIIEPDSVLLVVYGSKQ